MKIYHLKTCDTCRKAIKALRDEGHTPELIDVRADGVGPQDLAQIEKTIGFETLLNTRSATWRGLSDAEKQNLDRPKALALMNAHPTLIKRPVIASGDKITVGWSKDIQSKWL